MRQHLALLLLLCCLMASCARREDTGALDAATQSAASRESAQQALAYEHQVTIHTEADQVGATYQAGVSTCRAAAQSACVLLDSHVNTGEHANASLRVRVKPGWSPQLIKVMSAHGEVSQQSTTVEDLAAPMGDTRKKLDMLTSYRAKLESLQDRAANDVDAAMKIAKELTQVQSDIEALSGQQAHMLQRVNTEVVTVNIESDAQGSFWGPIRAALGNFNATLSQGISSAILGTAYLLPWAVVLGAVVFAGRKVWRRLKARP